MELRQLKYFLKLSELLNFSEAAKALCVTQSTLSQQVKQLEQDFGANLFVRDSHSVSLTEAGVELIPFALKTVKSSEECYQRMRDLQNVIVGNLNIGVTYSFSPILTETLFTFIKKYKGVKLNIFYKPMEELIGMLRRREIDFLLAFKPSESPADIESHPLFQNYLAAIVRDSHPLAGNEKVSLDDISRFNLALPSKGLQARNALEKIIENKHIDLKIKLELNDPTILMDIIRQSNMVTVLAEASIYRESGIKAVPIDVPGNEMEGCVHILSKSYHKKSMQEFIKLLRESIAVRERANAWL